MPRTERKRLSKQRRGPLDCGFLDIENHRCAIYPVRPWVCEAFGRVKGMQCPKVSGLVQIIPEFMQDAMFRAEYESGTALFSKNFDWREV